MEGFYIYNSTHHSRELKIGICAYGVEVFYLDDPYYPRPCENTKIQQELWNSLVRCISVRQIHICPLAYLILLRSSLNLHHSLNVSALIPRRRLEGLNADDWLL